MFTPLRFVVRRIAALAAVTLALLGTTQVAHAGRECSNKPASIATLMQAMDLAQRTAQNLDASGAQVVVLARQGQNLSEYGLRFSHLAFAYKDGNVWRVMHKLNQCGTAHSSLYKQGLGEFFMDDLYRYEAGYVVPTPEVQARLLNVLRDRNATVRLNQPRYNMLAYPWAQTYQQSNQWALETLAEAMEPGVDSREDAQSWLKLRRYTPTVLEIPTFKRLGARIGMANVAFDDQPFGQRMSGHIATVTVDSVFAWMERSKLSGTVQFVR
jgi:hypothetical protein